MLKRGPTLQILISLLFVVSALSQSNQGSPEARIRAYSKRIGAPTKTDSYLRAAANIDVNRRIGEYEAYVLVWAYFSTHINLCGGPDLPKENGNRWVAETRVGYSGAPGPQIIIEKKTGATYSSGRKKVTDPKEYLKFIIKR